jgi:Gpi18-like mannosyltransferase
MTQRNIMLGWIAYALMRCALLTYPGYVPDVLAYKRWSIQAARNGISQVYRTSRMDYPPLYAYVLAPLGTIDGWLEPEAYENLQDSTLLTVLVKSPPLVFDLAIAWLLYRLARMLRPGPAAWPWTWLLPAAYLLNPAVLFNNAFWGEPDSVHSFFVLASFLALGYGAGWRSTVGGKPASGGGTRMRRSRGAWPAFVLLTLAALMKPLAIPYFPLLLVVSLALYGLRSTLIGIGASAVTAAIVFAPFLADGQGAEVYDRVMGDVSAMPFTSVNAHNLWWLLGAWRKADVPWLGSITATQFSFVLFGCFYAAMLWKAHQLHRSQQGGLQPQQILLLAAALGFSFFILSTHMHENHMFTVIPLLAPLLLFAGPWRKLFIAVSLAVLLNLSLHDPALNRHWPFAIGGESGFENHHFGRPFYVTELTVIWLSTFFNLGLYAVFVLGLFRSGAKSLPASLEEGALIIPGSRASVSRSAAR